MNTKFPSKVLLLGDIHGSLAALVDSFYAARRAGIKVIIQVGDNWAYSPHELVKIRRQMQLNDIETYAFIRGNHEDYSVLGDRVDAPGAYELTNGVFFLSDGYRFTIGDKTAVVCGGAASIDRLVTGHDSNGRKIKPREEGKSWWPREVVTDADVKNVGDKPADLFFAHDTTNEGRKVCGLKFDGLNEISRMEDEGSRRNLESAVYAVNPNRLFHGHYHTFVEGTGRDGIRYTGLNMNGRVNNSVIYDAEKDEVISS